MIGNMITVLGLMFACFILGKQIAINDINNQSCWRDERVRGTKELCEEKLPRDLKCLQVWVPESGEDK